MLQGPGLWDGSAYFNTVMMTETSNKVETNTFLVSMGQISGCDRLTLMRVEGKYVFEASGMSTGDYMCKLLNMMKVRMAEELGRERALNIWEVFRTGFGEPRANCFCLLKLSSD